MSGLAAPLPISRSLCSSPHRRNLPTRQSGMERTRQEGYSRGTGKERTQGARAAMQDRAALSCSTASASSIVSTISACRQEAARRASSSAHLASCPSSPPLSPPSPPLSPSLTTTRAPDSGPWLPRQTARLSYADGVHLQVLEALATVARLDASLLHLVSQHVAHDASESQASTNRGSSACVKGGGGNGSGSSTRQRMLEACRVTSRPLFLAASSLAPTS